MGDLCFAYYCSGHGYGHATRVSALICHLLSIDTPFKIKAHIISSTPEHVFSESVALGASYRFAEIDPVIVQPLAYRVDRQKSVEALESFLIKKQAKLEKEREWLKDIGADCVLSDAAFLACLSAKAAGLPSILVTNFTFDSVYSYLSTPFVDAGSTPEQIPNPFEDLVPDIPVPLNILNPLVEQIHAGYRCADLLLLLPGYIPIPSFSTFPALPSQAWVDPLTNKFLPDIIKCLDQLPLLNQLHDPISAPLSHQIKKQTLPRRIQLAPLLVRSPTTTSSVYTREGRSRLLSSINVPSYLHDPSTTKILVVSFGGQVFHRPSSRQPSRPPSRPPSRGGLAGNPDLILNPENVTAETVAKKIADKVRPTDTSPQSNASTRYGINIAPEDPTISHQLVTSSHICIPGAPPATKPMNSTSPQQDHFSAFSMNLIVPSPINDSEEDYFQQEQEIDEGPRLLPDASWIAIVCGASNPRDSESELPDGFFIAPRDVYMPDLTAIADVLLGKLGYGTVSECVDSCTPFVYVSRPLFIEEHGLRLLLDREGVGVELSRQSYEAGDWAGAVEEAWAKGRESKWQKREIGVGERSQEHGRQMARMIVDWVREWQET